MRWQVYRLLRLIGNVVRFQHRGTHWCAAPLYQKQRYRSGLHNWLDCLASWYTSNLNLCILPCFYCQSHGHGVCTILTKRVLPIPGFWKARRHLINFFNLSKLSLLWTAVLFFGSKFSRLSAETEQQLRSQILTDCLTNVYLSTFKLIQTSSMRVLS